MGSANQISFFKNSHISGVEICRVEKSCHIFPEHAHDDLYALSLIESGASYCLGEQQSDLIVREGELVLLNPGQVHSGIPLDGRPVSYWMLYADVNTVKQLAGETSAKTGLVPEFTRMILKNNSLAARFEKVLTAFTHNREGNDVRLKQFLTDLFIETGRSKPVRPDLSETVGIQKAKRLLSRDLDTGIDMDALAKEVGFSRYYFSRLFKQKTGISPHQYRIQCRIRMAGKLIRDGRPFSEVALDTGFTDQSHFTNKFRQYTGATPSQYARLKNGLR